MPRRTRRAKRPVKMTMPQAERELMLRGLRRLGMISYREYLCSTHWRALRRRLLGDSCVCCGRREGLALHHSTYARLGAEPAHDLHTLCEGCHVAVHRASARTGHLMPLATRVTAEKRFGALKIGCPLCSARPGEYCHTLSCQPRVQEHKERRRVADALAKRKAAARPQKS
jgi:hypothetical protein